MGLQLLYHPMERSTTGTRRSLCGAEWDGRLQLFMTDLPRPLAVAVYDRGRGPAERLTRRGSVLSN